MGSFPPHVQFSAGWQLPPTSGINGINLMALKPMISRVSTLRKELGKKLQQEGCAVSAVGKGTDDNSLIKGNNQVINHDLCCMKWC